MSEKLPFCPVCKRRVEIRPVLISCDDEWHGIFSGSLRIAVCQACGTVFDPQQSESLAPRCSKCGGEDWREGMQVYDGFGNLLCRHCDGRDNIYMGLSTEWKVQGGAGGNTPIMESGAGSKVQADPRDALIEKYRRALKMIASDSDCPSDSPNYCDGRTCRDCDIEIARKALE